MLAHCCDRHPSAVTRPALPDPLGTPPECRTATPTSLWLREHLRRRRIGRRSSRPRPSPRQSPRRPQQLAQTAAATMTRCRWPRCARKPSRVSWEPAAAPNSAPPPPRRRSPPPPAAVGLPAAGMDRRPPCRSHGSHLPPPSRAQVGQEEDPAQRRRKESGSGSQEGGWPCKAASVGW